MRRVKMSCGRQAAGQPVSSSMRWTTWMESSTSTAWTPRPSSTSTGRPSTSRGNGPLPPKKESCKTVVISSSTHLENYIVLCKSIMFLFTRAHKLSSCKKNFWLTESDPAWFFLSGQTRAHHQDPHEPTRLNNHHCSGSNILCNIHIALT